MPTQQEEQQVSEFLKRADVRTMKKDLRALREVDALKEREKIIKLKTLEEQLAESASAKAMADKEKEKADKEKAGLEEVLGKREGEEKIAERDLKNYASEEEKQQIFLLESQRLGFEKQIDAIDKEKDPALKLEKNELLLQKRDREDRLNSVLEQEKKFQDEQKFIVEKEQTATAPSQKKGLEQSRWDLDKKIQEVEKKRWAVEKEIEDTDNKISQVDKSSDLLVAEKNELRNKVAGVNKSLRDIYSVVMAREEEKRRGQTEEQIARKEALAETRAEQKERIQRQQWAKPTPTPGKTPESFKEKLAKMTEAEEEQRRKFLQDVEIMSGEKPKTPPLPVPPVPKRK